MLDHQMKKMICITLAVLYFKTALFMSVPWEHLLCQAIKSLNSLPFSCYQTICCDLFSMHKV